jgi:hypothetical protein
MWKILIVIMLCCQISYGQDKTVYHELIVQVPELTEWKVFKISKQLACLDGLRFLGYFQAGSCLLLHIDGNKISNSDIITTTIHHLNEKLKTNEVKGYTIYDVLDNKYPYYSMNEKSLNKK